MTRRHICTKDDGDPFDGINEPHTRVSLDQSVQTPEGQSCEYLKRSS